MRHDVSQQSRSVVIGDDTVTAHALAFAATLTDRQRAELLQPYSPSTISRWSNFPQATLGRRQRRIGVQTGALTSVQWAALDDLLTVATGTGAELGHGRICQHLAADDYLRDLGGRHGYGRGNFLVAFLGVPAPTGTWELQFGGHHLAVANTYVDGVLVGATPSFRGIEPYGPFVHAGEQHDAERRPREAFTALLAALDDEQAARARLRGRHDDLSLGPGRDWAFPAEPDGLPASLLDDRQTSLLMQAIAAYVHDLPVDDAVRILAGYECELDRTHLAWAGGRSLTRAGDYVRIDGPSVWIELSMHSGIVLPDPHPHAVWRDKLTDYGGTRF